MNNGGSDSEEEFQQLKVVLLGNSSVGKTSIVRRFCENRFVDSYKPTVGVDFFNKKICIQNSKATVALQIWDVGGKQLEGDMIDHYLENCNIICCIFDFSNLSSLQNVEAWKECILRVFGEKPLPEMVLIGNKNDLEKKEVSDAMFQETALQYEMKPMTVSALTGEKITAMFTKIAADLVGVTYKEELDWEKVESPEKGEISSPAKVSPLHSLHVSGKKHKSKKNCLVM